MINKNLDFRNVPWTVGELMEKFQNYKIQVPEIQRDVVWNIKKVINLIDSIYSKYPCGSIILWEPGTRDKKFIKDFIRPERLDEIEKNDLDLPRYFIVDGQQRLTALVSSLLDPQYINKIEPDLNFDWGILFINLKQMPEIEIEASTDESEFKFPTVPLYKLYDNSILEHPEYKKLSAEKQNNIKNFRDRIREYSFPVQIVEECPYPIVANIFYRVNTGGQELTTAEIHIAQIVPYWKGITREFRKYLNKLEKMHYNFGLTFLIKCLSVLLNNNSNIAILSKKVKTGEITVKKLNRAWDECKKCINRIVMIVKKRSPLDKSTYLTSQNVFIPPVYYLHKSMKKNETVNEKKILQYLYYSQLGSHYESSTEYTLRKDLNCIREGADTLRGGLNRLCDNVKSEARTEYKGLKIARNRIEGPYNKHALLLFMYIAMLRAGARDFDLNNPIPIDEIPPKEIHRHHIFPFDHMMSVDVAKEYMEKRELPRSEYREKIDDIANITFISKSQNSSISSLSPFQYLDNYSSRENLKAHFIPLNKELWKSQKYDDFLNARRELLSKAINRLIKSL